MKSLLLPVVLIFGIFAGTATAQAPKVNALINNYGGILPGLPNYGIAQGSIFVIYGTNLSTASTGLQSVPLQTTLSGVSVAVTVNGTTTHPLLYYVLPTQVAAILPSNTPVGTGTLTLTNNGQASNAAEIKVVKSAFGIFSQDSSGHGIAGAQRYFLDQNSQLQASLVGYTGAANPGETIVLWGSGLGPVAGDESVAQTPRDMTEIPITVEIGGTQATVAYHGRSAYPGLDQINVTVPQGVSGCYVSVVVRTGDYISNFVSIPVAVSGRTCSDTTTGLSSNVLETLSKKQSFTIGSVGIGRSVVTTPAIVIGGQTVPGTGGTTTSDYSHGGFARYTPAVFSTSTYGASLLTSSIGSCTVYSLKGQNANVPSQGTSTPLNAGSPINVKGPNGTVAMPYKDGFYSAQLASGFLPDSGGAFTFDNGSGGPDVGAFMATLNMAAPLVWSNESSITTINRSQGVTVQWTGGDAGSYVVITGSSIQVDENNADNSLWGSFACTAPVSAHQFTVPATVLLTLPPSASIAGFAVGSSLSVATWTNPVAFNAPNVDYATTFAYVTYTNAGVTYQ